MNFSSRRRVLSALALACAGAAGSFARGADTWDNTSGDAKWFTATNWADDTVPTSSDAVTFPAPAPGGATPINMVSPIDANAQSLTLASSYTFSGALRLANGGVNVTSGAVARMSGQLRITTLNGLGKSGAGTLVLTTPDSTPYPASVGAGTLRLESANIISSATVLGTLELGGITLDKNITMTSGSTLSGTGASAMTGVMTANNAKVYIITSGTLTLGDGANDLAGSGDYISIAGAGTVVLTNSNAINTRWVPNGGTLQISADDQLGGTSSDLMFGGGILKITESMSSPRAIYLNPEGGGTIDVAATKTVTFTGTIGGGVSGTFAKSGGGNLIISGGAKTYSGPTIISGGALVVGQDSHMGDGSSTNKLTLDGGSLALAAPFISMRDVMLASGKEGVINLVGGSGAYGLGRLAGAGSVTVTGSAGMLSATHVRANVLTVQGVSLAIAPEGTTLATSVVNTINIAAAAKLDLSNNHLIVHAMPVGTWNGATYTDVSGLIRSGRGNGSWGGSGIVTSQTAATTSGLTSIGVATGAQVKGIVGTATAIWSGQTVTAGDVYVRRRRDAGRQD